MMHHKGRILLWLSLFWGSCSLAGSHVLPLDPQKRLEASIARDFLNRIAASNDRITQVFGDEASYSIQVDENRGQIFVKPSEANGLKPIALTVVTEMGQVQDLTLKPTDKGASTIILKGGSSKEESAKKSQSVAFLEMTMPVQEKMIRAMKMLVSGQFPSVEGEGLDRTCPEGFSLTQKESYQVGPFKGQKYEVVNKTDTLIDIEEKKFYQTGDLVLSLERRVLNAHQSTTLWVIHR